MALHLYNSLTKKLEVFQPIDPAHVRVYACGPTVYNYAHIGNARMATCFDLLVRLLRHLYPRVTYASNITDVDDKIMEAAQQTGEPIEMITRKYEKIYNEDLDYLNVHRPDIQPRATEHIPEMIAQIASLIAAQHAYVADHGGGQGTVLFHVPSYPSYGALSGRSREDQIAGARVEVAPYKKDPADFVLWKPSTPDQPGWDSPWGRGRPGWHIECSAMSEKHLGLPFDIHGGGADLKFPHHENEIAQSCGAHGHEHDPTSFSKVWIHNGFLTVEGDKMSKSLGNFTLTHELIEHKVPGEAIRWALLSSHYRSPLDWTQKRLDEATGHLNTLYKLLAQAETQNIEITEHDVDAQVLAALEDDVNAPLAFTRLIQLAQEAARNPATLKPLVASARLMGFLKQTSAAWFADTAEKRAQVDAVWVADKIAARQDAKTARDFKAADAIRDELMAKGVILKDNRDGTTSWDVT